MKLLILLFTLFATLNLVSAYPDTLLRGYDLTNITARDAAAIKEEMERLRKRDLVQFDAAEQYVDTTGGHKFVPPGRGDQRGPCPALNALANHNYLPHNGVGTIAQFVDAVHNVFGMGVDLATVLSTLGAITSGNGLKWSIGGPTPSVPALIPILQRQPQGISFSHNIYEGDGSPTRGDLYRFGNAYKLQIEQFQQLVDWADDPYNFNYNNLDILAQHRSARIHHEIATNPYYFVGPISGLAGQAGSHQFITLYANHSPEHPGGYLDLATLSSFFAVSGESGHFTYKEGWERIPDNWYRRPLLYSYDILQFSVDLNLKVLEYPEFIAIGGNTNGVNTFVGVNLEDLTGGIFNGDDMIEIPMALCVAISFAFTTASGAVTTLAELFTMLNPVLNAGFFCPEVNSFNLGAFDDYPGWKRKWF